MSNNFREVFGKPLGTHRIDDLIDYPTQLLLFFATQGLCTCGDNRIHYSFKRSEKLPNAPITLQKLHVC